MGSRTKSSRRPRPSRERVKRALLDAWKVAPDDEQVAAGVAAMMAKERLERMWRPIPNSPQKKAFDSTALEVLYGGGVGGAKTDLLIGKPLHKHRRSLILRRTFPEIDRTLVDRASEVYGDFGEFNAGKYYWTLSFGGKRRRIQFGHVDNAGDSFERPGDAKRYAGSAYDFIGFDQLEQFPEHTYLFLLTRARTVDPAQRVQVVSTANPVGEYVEWIMKRWAPWIDETHERPARPGEVRWFRRNDAGDEVECSARDRDATSRTYIPARLEDNPYLGDDYRRVINLMPEPARTALLKGNWSVMLTDDAYQVIPREWVKAAMERWRSAERPTHPITAMGVDCARGGADKHVISERRRRWFAALRKFPGRVVKRGQDALALMVGIPIGDAPVNVDVIGIGSSVYDFISEKYSAVAVNVGEAADEGATDRSGKFRFANKRAQLAWKLREDLDPEYGSDTALPDDPELLGDLVAMRYRISGDVIRIELKEELRARLGRSPDCGEAVILANADPPKPPARKRVTMVATVVRTEREIYGDMP